jgi:predicted GNAT family acetyltransferase
MKVEEVSYDEVKHLKAEAAKEGAAITDTRDTKWYAVADDGEVIAAAGLYRGGTFWRLKGDYVCGEYRGRGLYAALIQTRLDVCAEAFRGVEVFTYHPSIFESRGFVDCGFVPSGARVMRRNP